MKKQVRSQLIWAFLFGAMSFGANGQEPELNSEFEQTGITYRVTSTSPNPYEVKVVANTNTGDVVIPPVVANVQNWKVTGIGDNAFEDDHLTSVSIPEGVTHIGIKAFADNRDMTSVVIPSTVTSIGHTAFWNCGLASLEIPEGITDIGDNTFGRHKLASVTIPASVTSIGENAFITHPDSPSRMTWVTMLGSTPPTLQDNTFTTRGEIHVRVPDGAQDAYNQANDWTGFKSITFGFSSDDGINYEITSPTGVTVLDYTGSATSVNILGVVTHGSNTYTVTSIGDEAFKEKQLTNVAIPDGVTTIESGAFRDNKLTKVVIPDGVTSIGGQAFANNALESVTIPSGVTSIEAEAFRDNQLTEVIIPDGVTSVGINTFRNNHLTRVTLSSTVTNIATGVFRDNRLTSVVIPDGVTSIGWQAFMSNALESVTIGEKVTSIGGNAFDFNPNLVLVTVEAIDPPSLVAANAFTNRRLIDLIIPRGTLGAYQNPTNGWTGFRSIREEVAEGDNFTVDGITYKVTLLGSPNTDTVMDNTNTGSPTISGTVTYGGNDFEVTSIGANAFENNALTNVVIPDGVTSIGAEAFVNSALESVTIPSSVITIESDAFRDNNLTSVVIPDGVTSIGGQAFMNNALASVTIPSSVTTIESGTFRNNHLTDVTLSITVTSIGSNAFSGNPDLALVTAEATQPPSLHEKAFADRGQINLIVPTGTREDYLDNGWDGFRSIMEEGQVLSARSNIEFKDFTVYPNPARDKVHIDPGPAQKLKQVNIYTMSGAYLYSENELEINTGRLSKGMYLFEIVTQTGDRSMKRVIIQ